MPRIPPEELERLKSEIAVEQLVEASGVELKPAGKDLLGRCPLHEDREASLVVTPAKNLWHCFSCQIGGGPIDWVMKQRGVSFRHAVELLRSGSEAPAAQRGRGHRLLPAPVTLDAGDHALMDQAIRYYQERLKQTPEALAYLARRGLDDAELIERHRIGFADRTLGLRLPEKTRKAGHEIRSRLQKLGLLRESGHEHFNGSIVIPVITPTGEITEVYGRKINDNLREGTPYHLYLPGPHRGVWNEAALAASPEIILCEALIDALTFWRAGFRNVTASYGIEGITPDHLAAFQRHGTKRVLIAYDRDEAGERAAEKLAERLIGEGLECYRLQFPHGMDANEYALKVQPAAKSLGIVIRKAVWLGKGPAPAESPGQDVEHAPSAADIPPLAASVSAPSVAEVVTSESSAPDNPLADEVIASYGDRRYRVRGLAKNLSTETLKINLHIAQGDAYYVDTFDLYSARARHLYIVNAAKDLAVREEIVKADLGRLLLKLEALQQSRIEAALKVEPATPAMTEAERESALDLLRDPKLMDRILADYETCGLIGERTNKLVGYLAAVSRKLDRPLAVVVQSSSAAGKSSLMDAVLSFMPEEERIKYSAMTGQSLFYMGETNLKHKILAIVEEEGASRAAYALKLLQSEGELTIASTGKDPATGNLITQEYRVEGPVMIFLTTTAIEIDEELLNRCLVLTVDESREQTQAIHRLQRERRTLAGLRDTQRRRQRLAQHQNAQRLLAPLKVLNPYADRLTFLSDKTRTRRDHEKYLTLIDAIALLHQHQRTRRTVVECGETIEYIEATLTDIEIANRLAHEVLGRSLDELPPQTRRVLARIVELVEQECRAQHVQRAAYRFSRRQLREHTGLSDTQLRVHLERLVTLEYLLVHRGMRGQSFVYELVFDGPVASEAPHLSGLIDVSTMASSRGSGPQFAGSTRGQNGVNAAGSRSAEMLANPVNPSVPEETAAKGVKTHLLRPNGHNASYVQDAAAQRP
ncbi:MAG: toprim domain-containing protein [Proteobacteria bacterium]|nr:toprim domain-containing protein [Pseudomonadota bacterium]